MHTDPTNNESQLLEQKAARLRIDSIRATTAAGSGHPTSCASAAEIMAVLFSSVMRYDPAGPHDSRDVDRIIAVLEQELKQHSLVAWHPRLPDGAGQHAESRLQQVASALPPYKPGSKDVATRRAFGDALASREKNNPRIFVLDGDVKNSTYTEDFQKACPDRLLECFIAEQNMVGVAVGLAAQGKIPFASTFGCFLTRAYDFVRMAAIGGANIKLAGTHVGVSIGEDGPAQMALEDIAMMYAEPNDTVLYPSDATAAWRATELAMQHPGPCYLRLARPATPVFYSAP